MGDINTYNVYGILWKEVHRKTYRDMSLHYKVKLAIFSLING